MSSLQLAAVTCVIALSAWLQASVGFGYALVSAPLVALCSRELVPGPIMVSSFALSLAAAVRERGSIDRRGVMMGLCGRVPGAILAALAFVSFTQATLDLLFGTLILIAVAISLARVRVRPTTAALLAAGFASGLIGTLTSIGGPPMALVYQHEEGPRLRATLNAYFACGCLLSIALLFLAGRFHQRELVWGLLLMLPVGLGFALSGASRRMLDQGYTRRAVLAVASLAALAVVLRTLLG